MTNKDNAIRSLDQYKPRSYGSGIRTASIEQIAAQKNGTVRPDFVLKNFSEEEWKKQSKQQMIYTIGGVAGILVLAFTLVKLKLIKL
jgi:hypothetical protein